MSEWKNKTARERCLHDPVFKALVDMMLHQIILNKYTPSEMRDAAMCASIEYEMIHHKPVYLLGAEAERLKKEFPEFVDRLEG